VTDGGGTGSWLWLVKTKALRKKKERVRSVKDKIAPIIINIKKATWGWYKSGMST